MLSEEEKVLKEYAEKMVKISDDLKMTIKMLNTQVAISNPDLASINTTIGIINRYLKRLIHMTYPIVDVTGRYHELIGVPGIVQDISFEREDDHLRIILPELLPKRVEGEGAFSRMDLTKAYEPMFREYFSSRETIFRYRERVAIVVTYIYDAKTRVRDYDNIESKFLIDLITTHVLIDDAPKFCTVMYDYSYGEHSHTEVDVLPERDLCRFLKRRLNDKSNKEA